MQFRLNFGSFMVGVLCMLGIGVLISSQYPQDDSPIGRYDVKTMEEGFIILDTQTGLYILESEYNYSSNNNLLRGDFKIDYAAGKDLFSKK